MQLVCNQDTLATALKHASLFSDSRSPIPIYAYTKMEVEPGKLTLSAANNAFLFYTDVVLTDIVPATAGVICVQADRIADLVATLRPKCPVELSLEKQLHLRSGRTKAALDTLPASDFPVFADDFRQPQITITTGELDRVLARVLPSMGEDADRAMLWGMSLQYKKEEISAASCDGTFGALCLPHHLTLTDFPAAIIPRPVCQKLRNLLKGMTGAEGIVSISINPTAAKIVTSKWTIITRLVDAIYPLHEQLLLAPAVEYPLVLDSDELLAILARLTAGTDFDNTKLKQRGAVLKYTNGTVVLRDGHNTVTDTMDVVYQGEEIPPEIGFNTDHMREAVNAIDAPEIELHFTDRNSRIRVCAAGDTEESFTTMPYRV